MPRTPEDCQVGACAWSDSTNTSLKTTETVMRSGQFRTHRLTGNARKRGLELLLVPRATSLPVVNREVCSEGVRRVEFLQLV